MSRWRPSFPGERPTLGWLVLDWIEENLVVPDGASIGEPLTFTREQAQFVLELYEVDERGLDRLDRSVLDALCRLFDGGPVGLSTLALSVGEEIETVSEVAEPFLIREGLMFRTPRGRVATRAAYRHLGLRPPAAMPALFEDAE